jgi:hypothetical protein
MKYAIRVSHLPPCVIYADIQRTSTEVLAWVCVELSKSPGPFKLASEIYTGLTMDMLASNVRMVEDERAVVFTNTDDVDVLITRSPTGFNVHHITDAMDRDLLGR